MKNKAAVYKLILILICAVVALLPVAVSVDAKANETIRRAGASPSSEDEENVLLYSFGLLSDLHIQYDTGKEDFKRALTYLRDKVPFTCVCGDLVSYATEENMVQYREYVDAYSGGMPLYECAGNHDTYDFANGEVKAGILAGELLERWVDATGKENPNYSFEYGDDVFIFLSMKSDNPDDMFYGDGVKWLSEVLEANKSKRCFVFQHVQDSEDDTADPSNAYSDILNGISGREFLRLIKKYDNTIWFHGHTHLTFQGDYTPINESLGYRSVHIPSLASPRFYNEKQGVLENFYFDENNIKIWGALLSEGYIVDVYSDKIVLRGVNFASGSGRNQVELLDNKVFTLDTIFTYTEPAETTSKAVSEAETTATSIKTTAVISSAVEDVSESLSGTLLTSLAVTDPEETEIFPTWSTEVLTDPVESESVCETSTETSFDAETSFPSSVVSSSSQSETENLIGILGDSNTDGRVNIRDATQIRKFAAKLCNLSSDSEKCADVNSDSLVNIKDATLIQKYSANLETGVPMGMPVLV